MNLHPNRVFGNVQMYVSFEIKKTNFRQNRRDDLSGPVVSLLFLFTNIPDAHAYAIQELYVPVIVILDKGLLLTTF